MKSSSKSLSASLFLDDLLSKTLNRYQQKTSIDSGCPEGTTLVEEEYIKLQSVSPCVSVHMQTEVGIGEINSIHLTAIFLSWNFPETDMVMRKDI